MHLTKSQDFAAVHQHGRWLGGRLVGVKSRPNGLPTSRWGIITGKRVGKAVVRNLVKRRLREIFKVATLTAGFDVVLIARPEAANATFAQLQESAIKLLIQAGLWEKNEISGSGDD